MNLLLTGANGFLGKSIIKQLSEKYNLFKLSRFGCDYNFSLDRQIPYFDEPFDLVIHAAGKAHSVPKTEKQKKEFYEINVLGTENLLKGLERVGLPKEFIFISSVSVYGLEFGRAINEDFPLEARDSYGLSKIKAEKFVIDWCKKNDVICTVLRLPLLIGKDAPGNFGAMLKAIERGYYFNIDYGRARKSMLLAQDVASIVPVVASIGGIYNLTDGVHPDFKELGNAIAKQKKKKTPLSLPLFIMKLIGYIGDILGDKAPVNSSKIKKITSDLTFDDSKARKVLDWNPQSVLDYLKNNNF
ncbi:NAD-dependent epimerase/dehydratase family protein [Flavobacterium sp. RS13.1]|jgi:nucleoside-diphosphate-sugar epimerase|uniref:NAD-dependent epimerase/dehydratase family protein n=1 Tax=Flavobacterium sp. RS13.1 TaxID=3400345 RepID=UPI003AAB369C